MIESLETAEAMGAVTVIGECQGEISVTRRSSQEKVTGRFVVALLTEEKSAIGALTCKVVAESVTARFQTVGSAVPRCHTFIRSVVGLMPSA